MADLTVLSPTAGQYPSATSHFATKLYVDTEARDLPINPRTATYTLALSDRGRCVHVNNAASTQITVPANATVAFPIGTVIRIRKTGTGNVPVVGAAGVVIDWASTSTIVTRYTLAEIHKDAADHWYGVLLGA